MRLIIGLIVACSLAGCQKQEGEICVETKNLFYDQSHRSFLQLKGDVKGFREYKQDEAGVEKVLVGKLSFNPAGNLTEYDPSGSAADASAYWLPVFLERYSYDYDLQGRLSAVRISQSEGQSVSYKLIYGTHSDYVRLPFEIKPMGEWFVQGLLAIESDQPGFSFTYEAGHTVSLIPESGFLKEETASYQNGFVATGTVRYLDGSEVCRISETTYQFDDATGKPLFKKQTVTEADYTEFSEWIYDANGFCGKRSDSNTGEKCVTEYAYNSSNWLLDITVKGEVRNGTLNRSYEVDEVGNWTTCIQETTGFVSWEYPQGKEIIIREFIY